MRILFAAAECSPYAKVGGLADVVGSLPQALARAGDDTIVALPAYGVLVRRLRDFITETKTGIEVQVNPNRRLHAVVHIADYQGQIYWIIDGEERFRRVESSEDIYTMHRDDYLFFSLAILRVAEALDQIPDVVHAHDWHMGLLPALIRHRMGADWREVGTCFSIHNLAYQGEFGFDTLAAAGLPERLYNHDQLETYGGVNFLKAGAAMADQVNTVSPTYAQEITTPEFGCRLEGLMRHLHGSGRLRGILNGIDTKTHDPATDPDLPHHFSAETVGGKALCRASLLDELNLMADESQPVLAVISRLSSQKGFDLIAEAAPQLIESGARLVIQALGEPKLSELIRGLATAHPDQVRFVEEFNAPFAQRLYAGADAFLMPSRFEPCGLGQMFAMRYGTVPLVRATGGLADTVHDGINGFTFQEATAEALNEAGQRLIEAFRDKEKWSLLQQAGMTTDFGWDASAQLYQEMYRDAIKDRSPALLA